MTLIVEDGAVIDSVAGKLLLQVQPNRINFQNDAEIKLALSSIDHDVVSSYIDGDEVPCNCPGNDRFCQTCKGKGTVTCNVSYR